MSKRIPMYLSESELRLILSWFSFLDNQTYDLMTSSDTKLAERLEDELATFED